MFTKTEVRKWETKHDAEKTWAHARTSFETLFADKQTFQDDIGAGKSGIKSANNIGEARNQTLKFDV